MNKKKKIFFFTLLFVCLFLVFWGCTFPRIIVLEDPLTPEEHINLGVSYEKNGEPELAVKEYKLAAEKLSIAYLYLGNVYYQNHELDKAEEYYQKAIEKEPGSADACNNLAWLYYTKRTNLDEAESLALKAIELNSSKKNIYKDTLEKIRALKKSIK